MCNNTKYIKNKILILSVIIISFLLQSTAYSGGTVTEETMFSTSLNKNVTYKIYLPEGYDPNGTNTYRVVYFLHGAALTYNFYQFINGIVDNLVAEKMIQPIILVYANGACAPYAGSFYTNSLLYGKYEDYIYQDMVQYIDSHYKTRANKDSRCIMGHSMGGYGSMKMIFKHPDIYRAAASHSGTLDFHNFQVNLNMVISECPSGPPYVYSPLNGYASGIAFTMCGAFTPNLLNPPFYVNFILDSYGNIVPGTYANFLKNSVGYYTNNYNPESNLAIYFDCGYQDQYGLYYWNNNFRDTLNLRNIPFSYYNFTGNHTGQLPVRIPISLQFLDSAMNASVSDEMTALLITKVEGFEIQHGIKTALIAKLNSALISLNNGDTSSACISLQDFNNFVNAQKGKFITIEQADELNQDAFEIIVALKCNPGSLTINHNSPSKYILKQNYPNPFNPETKITAFLSPSEGGMQDVKLVIYDILGKELAVFTPPLGGGREGLLWEIKWNAANYSSGIYFYKLISDGEIIDTKKMILMK
jgi:S-formylglutathione hydrolase FrmB